MIFFSALGFDPPTFVYFLLLGFPHFLSLFREPHRSQLSMREQFMLIITPMCCEGPPSVDFAKRRGNDIRWTWDISLIQLNRPFGLQPFSSRSSRKAGLIVWTHIVMFAILRNHGPLLTVLVVENKMGAWPYSGLWYGLDIRRALPRDEMAHWSMNKILASFTCAWYMCAIGNSQDKTLRDWREKSQIYSQFRLMPAPSYPRPSRRSSLANCPNPEHLGKGSTRWRKTSISRL